jgi:5,10-methylenetetrahydromethanopterin reductase
MRFGFLFLARDLHTIAPLARLGEEQRFDLMALADSPALAHDPYVGLTLAALNTNRIRLGPAVTNAQTRHPLIVANLASTLERLAPGRTFLGLGTGNSGVRHVGAARSTLAGLAESVDQIRHLLAGDPVETGVALRLAPISVPILLAGSGPRSLRQAGQIADVVFFNLGVTPEIVADALRWIAEGAESAGRDPAEVEPWLYTVASIAEDRAEARDAATSGVIATAAYALPADAAANRLPQSVQEKVDQLLRDYDYAEHFTPGRSANYRLAERLGIADYLLDRFAIAGTPEDCRRHLESLHAVGLRNICLNFATAPDPAIPLRLFGQHVLPSLSD